MRIALVCDYSLSYLGGAQRSFLEQAKSLQAAGHHVTLLAPDGFPGRTGASAHWVSSRVTIPVVGLPFIRNTPHLRRQLASWFSADRIDIVHIHSEFGLAAAAVQTAKTLNIPTVHTIHTFFWDARLPQHLQGVASVAISSFHKWVRGNVDVEQSARTANEALRNMTLAAAATADIVISPSEHQRLKLLAAGARSVLQIPNTTVRAEARRPAPLDRTKGPLRIVWIGRCAQEKRLLTFIEACIKAAADLPLGALTVDVLGDGSLLRKAKRRASKHPNIRFSGRVTSQEVFAHLETSDLFALTSLGFDNQPMTIVESLYCARPVLYVDPDLTDGLDSSGFLCETPTADGIAKKIVSLAEDRSALLAASARAVTAFDKFSPDLVVRKLEKNLSVSFKRTKRNDAVQYRDARLGLDHALT